MKDKFSAVWLSHSSIRDYLKCPRAYFLRNMYKDPRTGHKITVMTPPLALGQAVHEVVESLSTLPVEDRLKEPLTEKLNQAWKKVEGEKGGFRDKEQEERFKEKGRAMLVKVEKNPGPILEKAIKIRQDLPHFWLSETDNIILCGKIDWLKYIEEKDAVHIIDFKTGKVEEDADSLQLPIYKLLADNCQKKKVDGASYWYLQKDDEPVEVELPDEDEAKETVLEIAKRVALARKVGRFVCKNKDGCAACIPLESVVAGKGELVATSEYNQDIYILN